MELLFLGTGAGVPAKHRNVTSIALKLLEERNQVWLVDCGEGTQQQILNTTLKPRKIDKIFITHLHGDHIFGLPGLLSSRSFQGGESPLTVYGPKGIKDYILTSLKISGTHLKYTLNFHEIYEEGVLFEDQQFKVSCLELDHGIQSFGYRFEEVDHKGMLQVEELKAIGVPFGPLYGRLKKGETITLENGQVIDGKKYVGKDQKGRIVAILGDTRKHPNSAILAKDADVLVHESTFDGEDRKMARNYFHSTTFDAAEIAKEANAKRLLLTHISARYLGKDVVELQKEAKTIFDNSYVVKDFDEIIIPLTRTDK
ncbi:ribonuclease Z [Carnobacterium divergens]|uniref:Ribonuclease Z n=1 Tax=Carnobacterium divergens DSM 20623 TaxID=1449336 RepID=A0A0R2HU42_CARDV|nr:ribonuclease Z [Carnobacterium divergens]KRN56226.1 putative metal-dependent hydrolase of the beta-lactamase superfamily III (putative) [Carnobacterium divergens DSM 20623]MDO0875183.1 ribonuclease Z [Carnobacterium divergens]SUX18611.1 Ribonuclease Z [Carnobacterium divergens]